MERIVIIPALNPDKGLRDIIEKNLELENQVILVDDGSDPEYADFFRELGEICIVLRHKKNRGKGETIKTALRYIKEELWECRLIGIMAADGQHLPEDMERLLMRAAAEPGTLILGTRTIDGNIPWKSRIGNQITRRVFQFTTGIKVSDTQSGLRAFSVGLLDFMLSVDGKRYEYEMNVLVNCARHKIPIVEVPVQTIYHDRDNSCSHFRKIRDSFRIYRQLLKFSAASLSSFVLDYGLFVLLTVLFPAGAAGVAAANVAARAVSGGYNYMVNCRYVFHEKQNVKTALDYLLLAVLILFLNSMFLQMFLHLLHFPVYPAKILTECTLFALSWTIQKKMIFRAEKRKNELEEKNSRRREPLPAAGISAFRKRAASSGKGGVC